MSTINYTSQSKKYFYLWKTPWIKNTRILRQAPGSPHGPAGNSPSNFPIHGALRDPRIPWKARRVAWRTRAGPLQQPGGPGPETGYPMWGARQGPSGLGVQAIPGWCPGPGLVGIELATSRDLCRTRRGQCPPSFKTSYLFPCSLKPCLTGTPESSAILRKA